MAKAATIFTGFDGAGIGIKAAGFDLAWGLELDDAIAQVARDNGHNVITGDILTADPHTFERVDALHASPPCTRASVANSSAEVDEDGLREAKMDIDLAMKTVEFIEVLRPRIVTIENVWGYRKFQSFKGGRKCEGLLPALERLGYWVDVQHVNSADFGVPQTRKRLILRAAKSAMVPHLPEPEPWVGWYEAIEDLIPTLPESQFAPWQLKRLPEELKSFLISHIDGLHRNPDEPAQTVVSSAKTVEPRAFLVNTNQSGDDGSGIVYAKDTAPSFTTKPADGGRLRAFLVNGALSGEGENKTLQIHDAAEPTGTIVSTMNSVKDTRAWLSQGCVVKMTSRALARFQSFPDTYKLPNNNALACKGIGNACPPLLFEKLYRQLRGLL